MFRPSSATRTASDVLLVNMPFGPLVTPSLALSLIKPLIQKAGISARVAYANIEFAEAIGYQTYHYIACGLPRAHDLVGEFIFSRSLFRDKAVRPAAYLEYLNNAFSDFRRQHHFAASETLMEALAQKLPDFVELADAFIERKAAEIAEAGIRLVGFTSAFQQNTASLALARRLRERAPELKIMMGGANCEGAMGKRIFDEFDFIDCVVTGEAEPVVVEAVEYLLETRETPPGGTALIRDAGIQPRGHAMALDLDGLPLPDYADFFAAVEGRDLPEHPRLLFETSRGCWWGEKHHCKFCGLNGGTMKFRKKSSSVALQQVIELNRRYPDHAICMTDNIIDNGYLRTFVPALAERKLKVDLFYEMKANLKKEHIALIAEAGISRIQPGIESFSDRILAEMDKGISALQNLQLLKWCREYGVDPAWNFLWGFPNEPKEEYSRMARAIPKVTHLKPPAGVGRLRLDRFSPYFENSARYFKNVRPFPAYPLVYPLSAAAVRDIAYFFDGDMLDDANPGEYAETLMLELMKWKASAESCFLFFQDFGTVLAIFDTRKNSGENCEMTLLHGLDRELLLFADGVTGISVAEDRFSNRYGADAVASRIAALEKKEFLIADDKKMLSLAVKGSGRYPGHEFWQQFRERAATENRLQMTA